MSTIATNTSSSNITDGYYYHDPGSAYWAYVFTFIFSISIFNIIGNSLIIQAIVKNDYGVPPGRRQRRQLRVPSNYFLFSLAISDLMLGIVYPIYNVSHMATPEIKESLGQWPVCEVILIFTLGLLYISSFNLVGIAFTRYFSIRYPLKFIRLFTHRVASVAVAAVWVTLTAIACGIYIRKEPPTKFHGECRYEEVLGKNDIIITTTLFVLLPLVVMIGLYAHMTVIAGREIRTLTAQDRRVSNPWGSQRELILRRELKLFKTAVILLMYFVLAWMPFVIFEFCTMKDDDDDNSEPNPWLRATVRIILHSNTAINILIYSMRLQDFREAIKTNIRNCFRRCGCLSTST